ncbi:hypothetical protein M2158_003691 [Streptomyces sp. SAI-144]|jgi:hypothetical protein|uniref:hypothetical protein n=1 Tax=unclassified Streptomyces TaxID=2593676 RepID=UPI00247325DE|nr:MULTISPECIES: hypothetical protein [unclassified Streptomyces]MDH6435214.1 hypothetical protein [Streptomyces sp. SAI-144]MDH6489335.1 hypothetical protein [Streptomyces sp. SAI-127]
MPTASDVRPSIGRPDVTTALVEEAVLGDPARVEAAAAAVVAHWESAAWPTGLLSLTLFTGTDGTSLLTYAQWSTADGSEEALRTAYATLRPDWRTLGFEPGEPRAFALYRRVQPTVLPDPLPPVGCYPAAFFSMNGGDTARSWTDGLLGTEEKTVGEDRSYPGAIAANFHVSADDSGIFLLSEWASEAEALVHIKAEIEPLLEYMGQAEAGAGRRYGFHASVSAAG